MSTLLFCAFVGVLRSVYGDCTKSLANPPEIRHGAGDGDTEWEAVEGQPNTWATTIVFDAYTQEFPDIDCVIRGRYFNGHFPSQTIRMKRGNQYLVTLENKLGPESPDNPTEMNVVKDCNTTNIHTQLTRTCTSDGSC